MTFMTIAQSIAEQAEHLQAELQKANARADLNQREIDRVCIERATERNRADAAEAEITRLQAEHAKRVQECVVQRARAADAEAEVARLTAAVETATADAALAEATIVGLEKDREAALAEARDLRTHADNMYTEGKKTQAEYADLWAYVDAAFKVLGKREDESFEGCAARIMAGAESLRKERAAVARTAYKDFDTLSAHVAKAHNTLDSRLGESIEDSAKRGVKERDGMFACAAERAARIDDLEEERDAARAELARVREALNVLMSEGKKGGGS